MAAPIIISLSGGGKTASAVPFPKNTSGNSKTLPKPFRALAPLPNTPWSWRSEEHTSELQSRLHLVCRLLLEKKKNTDHQHRLETQPQASDTAAQADLTS